jgi:hypothetical protein
MITAVRLKTPMQFGDLRQNNFSADNGYSFAIQSGCVVVRSPEGVTKSRPLDNLLEADGCPAAPPAARAK